MPRDLDVLFVPGGDGTPGQMRDAVLPLLGAEPTAERVVFDRNRATAAGIAAGLDLALALAARLRRPDYARIAQLVAEYAPEPTILRAADPILAPLAAAATAARG